MGFYKVQRLYYYSRIVLHNSRKKLHKTHISITLFNQYIHCVTWHLILTLLKIQNRYMIGPEKAKKLSPMATSQVKLD